MYVSSESRQFLQVWIFQAKYLFRQFCNQKGLEHLLLRPLTSFMLFWFQLYFLLCIFNVENFKHAQCMLLLFLIMLTSIKKQLICCIVVLIIWDFLPVWLSHLQLLMTLFALFLFLPSIISPGLLLFSQVWRFHNPIDCSLPGSSVHGISQARILEWIAISFSRGSSWPRNQTWVSCIAGGFFTDWVTREALILND